MNLHDHISAFRAPLLPQDLWGSSSSCAECAGGETACAHCQGAVAVAADAPFDQHLSDEMLEVRDSASLEMLGAAPEPTVEPGQGAGLGSAIYGALSIAGATTGAYHGLKRNNGSVGWAVAWFLLGGMFPFATIPISLAQGFGEPEKKSG